MSRPHFQHLVFLAYFQVISIAVSYTHLYYTYGASFGGPIIKDKLFFFVNGEYEDNVTAGSNYRPRTALGESYSCGNIHRPLQRCV